MCVYSSGAAAGDPVHPASPAHPPPQEPPTQTTPPFLCVVSRFSLSLHDFFVGRDVKVWQLMLYERMNRMDG